MELADRPCVKKNNSLLIILLPTEESALKSWGPGGLTLGTIYSSYVATMTQS